MFTVERDLRISHALVSQTERESAVNIESGDSPLFVHYLAQRASFPMMFFALFICILHVSIAVDDDKSTRQRLTANIFKGYDYKKAPPGVTTVSVSFGVQHVSFPFDDSPLAQVICTVGYKWEDKRLMWNPQDYGGLMKTTLPANHKLWTPQNLGNMDGKNHKVATTAHLLKGIELEVKERGREAVASISIYRRIQLEMVCEKESSFPTILKCLFHGTSKDNNTRWSFINGNRLAGFVDDNTTGTGLYEIESVYGMGSENYYYSRKESTDLSVSIRLRAIGASSQWILSTAFLFVLSTLVLIAFLLPPSHPHLHSFVIILIFLHILMAYQLINTIESHFSFDVPSQAKIYAFLFLLTTLVIPIQDFFGSDSKKFDDVLSLAQRLPPIKSAHSALFPYTKDFDLPFMSIFLKAIVFILIIVSIVVICIV